MALPDPGPIAKKALADSIANLGTHEVGGNNFGPAIKIYLASVGLGQGNPWCMAYQEYRLQHASKELGIPLHDKLYITGSCTLMAEWAKSHGLFLPVSLAVRNPSLVCPSDLGVFWSGVSHRYYHVGMVRTVTSTGVMHIEGNTGPTPGNVVSDGDGHIADGVYQKSRSFAQFGSEGGFIRLNF